jgi:hypothetical protein
LLSASAADSLNRWREYFRKVSEGLFLLRHSSFIPHLPWSSSFPVHIELEFHRVGGNVITVYDLAEYLEVVIIPFVENKLKIISGDKSIRIKEILDRISILKEYFRSMLGDNMTFERYYQIRGRHKDKIRQL